MDTFDENSASIFLRTALAAAPKAAEISRSYYAGNFTVTTKEDLTPVTQADVECEQAIRQIILDEFPNHGFFGEETGRTRADAEYLWLVDPIDGTVNFSHGLPRWCCSIGVLQGGRPVVGVIYAPVLGKLYAAAWNADKARLHFREALLYRPDLIDAYRWLTNDAIAAGRPIEEHTEPSLPAE